MKGFGNLPGWFMPSTKARPFRMDQRIDLVPAANPPTYGGNRFVPFRYKVPKSQALVVQSMAFCLWQRINIEDTDATYQLLGNADVAGKVLFTPIVEGNTALFLENRHNPAAILANATNTPPLFSAGFTSVSENPDVDLLASWFNPLFSFVVRSEQTLEVLFEVLTVDTGMTTLSITNDPLVTSRVDFAGVYVAGQLLSDADYTALVAEQEQKG